MSRDLHDLLEETARRPSEPLDVEELWRRTRRRQKGARAGLAAAVVALAALVAGVVFLPDGRVEPPVIDPPGEQSPWVPSATWTVMGDAPFEGRSSAGAVWTGSEMIVVGGLPPGEAVAYDPGTDAWRMLADAPIAPRSSPAVAWTGSEVLVWGGYTHADFPDAPDPERGGYMYQGSGVSQLDGAAYDPASGTWRQIAAPFAVPDDLAYGFNTYGVWTGEELLVFVQHRIERVWQAAAYNPETDTWRETSPPPAGVDGPLVWADGRGLALGDQPYVYDPNTDEWNSVRGRPFPGGNWRDGAVWTGQRAVVWSPLDDEWRFATYEPDTQRWRELPDPPARLTDSTFQLDAVWTGQWVVFTGGRSTHVGGDAPMLVAVLDPQTGTWHELPGGPIQSRHYAATAWTGQELIIWGGSATAVGDELPLLHDGARLQLHPGEPPTTVGDPPDRDGDQPARPWDPSAQMRPDLMFAEPGVATQGQTVELFFPEETMRGHAFVLERRISDSWGYEYLLFADTHTAIGWVRAGDDHAIDDIGIAGPGPDRVVIPEVATVGQYRICTANAIDNYCAGITVADTDGADGTHGERIRFGDQRLSGMCEGVHLDFIEGAPGTPTPEEAIAEFVQAHSVLEDTRLENGTIYYDGQVVGSFTLEEAPAGGWRIPDADWCYP